MSVEFSKARVLSPNKRYCVFIYDFGCLYDDIHAKAFVLPHAVEGKNIFFSTEGQFYFGENGFLYIQDEALLLRFDLTKEEVVSIDLEAVKGWQILSFEDYGRSARINYKAYPHNEQRQEKVWFKRGYRRLRNHVLPTGGAISKVNRKAYLDCILQDLHMHYLRSA